MKKIQKNDEKENRFNAFKDKISPKQKWKVASKQLYGDKRGHAEFFLENQKLIRGSKQVANVFNRF